ncbi:MAG: alpha/beta hydrolase, partial [Gemmatimonadota bacterium]
TDLTEDCRKFDVPTLIIHGDDDQIVPIIAAAMQSSKLIKGSELKIYAGQPHGICTTQKDRVNADLLTFLQSLPHAAATKTESRQTAGIAS